MRTPLTSKLEKLGWLTASQKMAGTVVSTVMRSSAMAVRKRCTSKAGITTAVPPCRRVGSSWLLHPVTWNSGTLIRLRAVGSCSGRSATRRQLSMLVRKFRWLVIAPFGNPVVPEV